MPLQEQVVNLSFSQGLETKVDQKQVMPTKLLELENATFQSPLSLQKRNGYAALSTNVINGSPSTITNGNSVSSLDNALIMSDGYSIYKRTDADLGWVRAGSKQASTTTASPLTNNGGFCHQVVKTSAGLEIHTYISPNQFSINAQVYITYYDPISKTVLYTSSVVNVSGTGSSAAVAYPIINGSNLVLFVADSGLGTVVAYTYPLTVPTTSPTTNAVLTIDTTQPFFDVALVGTDYYMIYCTPSTKVPTLISKNSSFSTTHGPTSVSSNACVGGARIMYSSVLSQIKYAFVDSTNAVVGTASTSLVGLGSVNLKANSTVSGSPALYNIAMGFCDSGNTEIMAYVSYVIEYTTPASVPIIATDRFFVDGATTSSFSVVGTAMSVEIYSNPFGIGSISDTGRFAYGALASTDQLQPTIFIIRDDITSSNFQTNVVAKLAYLTGPTTTAWSSNFPNGLARGAVSKFWELDTSTFLLGYPEIIEDSIEQSGAQNIILYEAKRGLLTLNTKGRYREIAGDSAISGGVISSFDGYHVFEEGFHLFPSRASFTPTAGTGIGAGTYAYAVVYEFIDNQGNVYRSRPGFISSVTLTSGQNVAVRVPSITVSDYFKLQNSFVKIYRTQKDGSVYFLLVTTPNYPSNNKIVTYTDSITDTLLSGNNQLYTTGGEVANDPPPPAQLTTTFKNRLVAVDSTNPLNWWFSKQVIQGFPPEFSDLFVQSIDQRGGDITALATMDDKLLFFKKSLIFYVVGDGPTPAGTNNDFSYPQIITTPVGCTNQDSLVLIPNGIMFQSDQGIWLLDRGLGVSYIGSPVERYNNLRVTSAQVIPNTTQIRFTLNDNITILVYDYLVQQWSTFTNLNAIDATISAGTYSFLRPDGAVWTETPGTYTDNGAVISLKLKTAWMSFAQFQGFERIKQLLFAARIFTSTVLTYTFSVDYNDSVVQTTQVALSSANDAEQCRIFLNKQKCEAASITLVETPTASTGLFQLSAFGLNIAGKKGLFKLPSAKTFK